VTSISTAHQPDPALVRECASRIITSEIDAIRDLGAMDIGEMCEDEIVATQEPLGGCDAPGASDVADALINAVREDIKAAVITHTWAVAAADTGNPVDITAIRSQLVERAAEYSRQRRLFYKAMRKEVHIEDIEAGASWAWEGLATAAVYMHAVAFLLRVTEQDDPVVAQKLARIVEYVMDAGMEALEDANDDLDKQARATAGGAQ
jgi:hypothetical protein